MYKLNLNFNYLKVSPDLFYKKINDSYLLVHPDKPSWIIVNDFGKRIVEFLNGRNSVFDLVRILKPYYYVDKHTLEKDIKEFIGLLYTSGIADENQKHIKIEDQFYSNIFIHITANCNLRCKHCYLPPKNKSNSNKLSDGEIINIMERFYKDGGKVVTLSGGEPFLRKNLIKRIIELNNEATVKILTNGTMIDDTVISIVAGKNVSIQISIDGSNSDIHDRIRGQGSFKAVLSGIKSLTGKGMINKINVCTTVMKHNINDLKNIIKLACNLGITFIRFVPLRKRGLAFRNWNEINHDMSVEEYELFYDYILNRAKNEFPDIAISSGLCGFVIDGKIFDDNGSWCPIGKNLVIDETGDVYPCVMMMSREYKLGNIKEGSILKFKESRVLQNTITLVSERKEKIAKCKSCMWKNFCQAGCMGLAFETFGDTLHSDGFCSFRKKLYDNTMKKLVDSKLILISNGESKCH